MKTRTGRTTIFLALLFLTAANPAFAIELFTQDVYSTGGYLQLRYTYYLNAAGEKVKHGTSTQWYTPPAYLVSQVAQIQRYSHGKLHGLDEAWYPPSYTYGYVKHWEKEYQDGLLHGVSRDWYQETGQPKSYAVYRYEKLHGAYKTWHYYRGDQLIDATYQDGLLHGHYKKWVVQNYSSGGYNYGLMQFQSEEGDYEYGKMHGYWKRWWTTASYPWYVKEEGSYGNNVKCGTWKYYYSTNGNLQSTVNEGPCQDVLPPGVGDPLPPGNKYEIRGHVTDKETHTPVSGALVQAGSADTTSNDEGFYSLVLDDSGTYTLNCVKDGYHDFTRQVELITAQYVDVDIDMKQKEPGGKPAVVSVDSTGGNFFIEGFTAENEYVVAVDWNGDAPGTLKFEVNGTVYETSADQSGGRYTFDMGSAFAGSLSPTGNTLKITAVNDSGVASEPETFHPIVIPLPSWSVKMGDFEIKEDGKHLVYKLDTSWPEEPIEILVDENHLGSVLWTAWGFVPYVGGRVFGIPGTQSFLTIEAKTDGSGSIAAGGKSGFNAAGGEIEIKLGAKGNLQYEPDRGLEWKETSLILGLSGTIERSVGPVTLIPALEGAVSLPVIGGAIGWFNERAEIKGTISSGSEMALEIMSATGEIGFNRADVETSAGIGLGLGIDIIENLSAEVSGGGTAKVLWQVPAAPDYFKKLETELTANITFSFLGFEWTTGYTHPFAYPESEPLALRIPLALPVLGPVSRDFLTKGPYNVQASQAYRLPMEIGGTGLQSDHKIIENVFPYSEPAIAVHNGLAAIAYVYLDPNDPVHQDTEIYVTLFNGTTYSTPAPILNDTRAEFSPTIAFDGSGKIVCAWQRVKDENFTSDQIEDLATAMEIVYAVYDPAASTPAWTEPLAMTDNGYMDYNPMLRAGPDGSLLLLWFSNAGNRLIGDSEHPTVAHYAVWNGSGFGTPESLAAAFETCFKFSLAYSGTEATLAYTKDMDGVLVTPQGATEPAGNDQEIFFLTFDGAAWSTPVRVTDDAIPDANPQVAYRANNRELAWLRGNALVRLTGLDPLSLEPVREGVFSAGMIDFRLYADPEDRLVLIWQDSDEKGIDLFYSVYDYANAVWSNDLRLTEDAPMEKDFSGVFAEDGLFHMVFNKKDLGAGITDLFHLTYALAVDLAVGPADLRVEPAAPSPGDDVQLVCSVTNQGDLAVVNGTVSFYLGNPASGGTLLATENIAPATLKAGEIGLATLQWTLPPEIAPYTVYAVADAGEGVLEDETNNTAHVDVLKPDVNALRCLLERNPDGSTAVRVLVRNDGFLAAENVELLFKAGENIVGTMTIPGILAGKTAEVVFPASLEQYSYSTWEPLVSVTADPENWIPEISEDNNTASFVYTLEIVSPLIQDFGQVHYGGGIQTVTIFNKTTTGLAIGSIVLSGDDAGDFRIFDDPISGTTILPLKSGLVGVAFAPTSLGAKNAELLIRDNDGKVLWRVQLKGQLDNLVPGDVDDDGDVGLSDAILALQVVAGLNPQGIYSIVDVNGDGRIGLAEALYAIQGAAEMR